MNDIKFDFNNMMSFNVGNRDGVTERELRRLLPRVAQCHRHFRSLSENPASRVRLSLEWLMLPFQDKRRSRISRGLETRSAASTRTSCLWGSAVPIWA